MTKEQTIEAARSLRKELITKDEPLKAFHMLQALNLPELEEEKQKTFSMVRHMFDYDFYKQYYGEHLPEHPVDDTMIFRAQELFPRFAWLINRVTADKAKSLIDLGCADGVLALTCAYRGIKSKGVNLYRPSIELARQRAQKTNIENVDFEVGDVFDVTGQYDAVVAMEIIEHVPDPQKLVNKMSELCSPEGWMYISTPDGPFGNGEGNRGNWELKGDMDVRGHVRVFTKESLGALLEGFEIGEWADLNDGLLHVKFRRSRGN